MNHVQKRILAVVSLVVLAAACKSDPGPDAIAPKGSGCVACHSIAVAARRQILGTAGDFGANASLLSHHVTGEPTSEQCLVCHDLSTHMTGTVRLRNADTGASIAYDPLNPASLEPFCLSCHDADGASATFAAGGTASNPFNDGSVLGGLPPNLYEAGNKIAAYWTGSANTHRSVGALTCAGIGSPNTGCHGSAGRINMHGSTSRGLLTNNMNFQIPLTFDAVPPASTVESNYKLCFDCHENYPTVTKRVVLGYQAGGVYDIPVAPSPYHTDALGTAITIKSLFRDRFIVLPANYPLAWGGIDQLYNDGSWLPQYEYVPLHNYHLLGRDTAFLTWKYRGDPGQVGRITCTACHNVHGTNGTVRSTYAELGIAAVNFPYGAVAPDSYRTLDPISNFDDAVFRAYPLNCNSGCHQNLGATSYWFSPAGE